MCHVSLEADNERKQWILQTWVIGNIALLQKNCPLTHPPNPHPSTPPPSKGSLGAWGNVWREQPSPGLSRHPGVGFRGFSPESLCKHTQAWPEGSEGIFLCGLKRKAGGLLETGGWQEAQSQTSWQASHSEDAREDQWLYHSKAKPVIVQYELTRSVDFTVLCPEVPEVLKGHSLVTIINWGAGAGGGEGQKSGF